jgi:precorrin-6A/cobalt-precorrin-6A reductase
MKVLILGGTTEANLLSATISGRSDLRPVLSLAGRTRRPQTPSIPYRIGGFGGVDGLKNYLKQTTIQIIIDATHPFATQMSRHAIIASCEMQLPLIVFGRQPWRAQTGDRWSLVNSVSEAVDALGSRPRTVFLTIGALQLQKFALAPQHRYLVRTIDRPQPIRNFGWHRLILDRGPFRIQDEIALMRNEGVEVLVAKNSGGSATEAKLIAARTLGIDVLMIERPSAEESETVYSVDAVLSRIESHRTSE